MKYFLFSLAFFLGIIVSQNLSAQTVTLNENWWRPNGYVYAIEKDTINNIVYVGGNFTSFSPTEPYGTTIDINTNTTNFLTPNPNNNVICSISDGNGGWFVGGEFTMVGDSLRKSVFHLDQFGNITNFALDVNGPITTMSLSGSTLYMGGWFTNINGQARNRLASVDIQTSTLNSWNPNPNNFIQTLTVSGSTVYIGGAFTTIGGQPRNRVAAVDALTGTVTTWNPNSNGEVRTIAIANSVAYVGGEFTNIGGLSRNHLAALDITTGAANLWNPNSNNLVHEIEVVDTTVYVGGVFTTIGGQPRNYVAAINSNSGISTSWNPNVTVGNGTVGVFEIEVSDSSIFLAGSFIAIGGLSHGNLGEVDLVTGAPLPLDVNSNDMVYSISLSGSKMYVGGQFNSIGGASRNNLVALNGTTGIPTSWNPNVNGIVKDIQLIGSSIYIGGEFTTINGTQRNYIGAIDIQTGLPTSWNPNADNVVNVIVLNGSSIYLGGSFTSVGGQALSKIAKVDLVSGSVASWGPIINSEVYTLAITNTTVYVGGVFNQVDGQTRNALAAIDLITGNLTSWNPNPISTYPLISLRIHKILPKGNLVYIAGTFNEIGGSNNNSGLALIDASTGIPTSWTSNVDYLTNGTLDGGIWDIDTSAGNLFIGGNFNSLSWLNHRSFGVINESSAAPLPIFFNLPTGGTVVDLELNGTSLFLGGSFITINGVQVPYFAPFTICYPTSSLTTLSANCDFLWNGVTYTTSGTYLDTLVNFAGCDSIATLNLTINNSSSLTNMSACQTFTWTNGATYFSSGIYTQSLTNIYGCDSIATLNLSINQPNSSSQNITACNSYQWPQNGLTYATSGIYIDTVQNVFGCDSIITLNLTINLSSVGTQTITAYDSLNWGINGQTYSNSGIYSDTIANVNGCDSVITLNLTILPNIPLSVQTFMTPTAANDCLGVLEVELVGDPDFQLSVDGATPIINSTGVQAIGNHCPGIHNLSVEDASGDTLSLTYVIAVDSNYIYNNVYVDSTAIDSLGFNTSNCFVDYTTIDTAYIAQAFATGNTVTVVWEIISSTGISNDTVDYIMNQGNGVYTLQLSIYCLNKSISDYFGVAEDIYFENGNISQAGIHMNELDDQIDILPNPADDHITIVSTAPFEKIELYNLNGKQISEYNISGKQLKIDLRDFEPSVYILRIIKGNSVVTRRIVVL